MWGAVGRRRQDVGSVWHDTVGSRGICRTSAYAIVLMAYAHLLAENKSLPPTFTYLLGGQQMAS